MKIRWTRDSIRFRITPTELEALLHSQIVREGLTFPGGSWSATILPGCAVTDLRLVDGDMLLHLSAADRARLAEPDAEGVYFPEEGEEGLRYCIEKDFPCAHPRASEAQEPETETFDAPPGFRERKTGEGEPAAPKKRRVSRKTA